MKTQAMRASPFAKPFAERITPWEAKLVRLQDIMDQWLKCQSKWQGLTLVHFSAQLERFLWDKGCA